MLGRSKGAGAPAEGRLAGQKLHDHVKVYYPDDPDPWKAGKGLAFAPFVLESLGAEPFQYWLMDPAEQAGLAYLLEHLRPKVAIEIGTGFGGSLQVLSRHCGHVYSLDVDPAIPRRLEGRFGNVEYIIGPSSRTLPPLIRRLQAEGAELGFALVDGDHTTEGVKRDIDALLRFTPTVPFYIIMHDSFNPAVREGVRLAGWSENPHVHAVELDFVAGGISTSPAARGEMWGGLALAVLKPQKRQGHFEITGCANLTFRVVRLPSSLWSLVRSRRRALGNARQRLFGRSGALDT